MFTISGLGRNRAIEGPGCLNEHPPVGDDVPNDVLTRLPMHLNSRIDELLPHNWDPATHFSPD